MKMLTLYHNPFSQHCRRVVSLLEQEGIPFEIRPIAMDRGEHRSAAYLEINPNHQVPTLIDGAVKIHESNAILRYICLKHRLTDWYPREPAVRAIVEQWLDWNQCRLGPAVVDIVLNKVFMGDKGDQAAIQRGEARLAEAAPILEAGLAGKDYLAGDKPTIADLSVASNVFHLGFAKAQPDGPATIAWFGRISVLPGFQKSLPPAMA